MIAANAVPPALRSFLRKSGSASEQLITVKPATTPTSPVSRQWPLKIVIALTLGLVFNAALALLIELFRDRFPDPDELGQALGHPVLATIPTLRLHPVPALATREAPRTDPAVGVEGSIDGEGGSHATSSRAGSER